VKWDNLLKKIGESKEMTQEVYTPEEEDEDEDGECIDIDEEFCPGGTVKLGVMIVHIRGGESVWHRELHPPPVVDGYCMFNGCNAKSLSGKEAEIHAASHPSAKQILAELGLDAPALYKKMALKPHIRYGSMLFIASSIASLADPEKISKFNGEVVWGGLIKEKVYVFEVVDSPTKILSGRCLADWLAG
jgi:hypothetical protein